MADSREALRQLATQIRDEHKLGANTATRVGSLLLALVDAGANIEDLTDFFIRKDIPNAAHERITFEKGITVLDLAKLMNLEVTELATMAQAVCQILRSSKFVDGFSGEGYQIWKDIATGDWNFTIDRITARKVMNIYELIINKLRSVGGMIVVSAGNGKVKTVELLGDKYALTFEELNTFEKHDLLRCQVFTGKDVKYYWVAAKSVIGDKVFIPVSEFEGVEPAVGDEIVLMGNETNKRRQSLIMISATEDGQPRIDVLDGVCSKSFEGCLTVRLGNLSGISDSRFPANEQPRGNGLYSGNCFLSGVFVLANGKDVLTMFKVVEGAIMGEVSTVRKEANKTDNYLNNASFGCDMEHWTVDNDIHLFSVESHFQNLNQNFYSEKNRVAFITEYESRYALRIKISSVMQKNGDFASHPEFDYIQDIDGNVSGLKAARMFYLSFMYKVVKPGTLTIRFTDAEGGDSFEPFEKIGCVKELIPGTCFERMEIAGKWDGKGDFVMEFDGDIYIYNLALTSRSIDDLFDKFSTKFEQTDRKIQLSAEEIHSNADKIEEYRGDLTVTAREIRGELSETAKDLTNSITEAYEGYVSLTAKGLSGEFTEKIDGVSKAFGEFKITAEQTLFSHGGSIEASNRAIEAANQAIIGAQRTADEANKTAGENATALVQTDAAIASIAGRFDANGKLIEGAGWITTADANSWWVKKGEVISSINQSAEAVSIDASKINLNGVVTANNYFKILRDGSMEANKGTFKNVIIQGSIRSPFVQETDAIIIGGEQSTHDNVATISTGGGWETSGNLEWDVNQSGRRMCITNYRWGNQLSAGRISYNAPSGMYFYENGISKTEISLSRECVELMGYGTSTQFYGWIVLNRIDLMQQKGEIRDAPGVLWCGRCNSGGGIIESWGNGTPGNVSVRRDSTGYYTVTHAIGHTQYFVTAMANLFTASGNNWAVVARYVDFCANSFRLGFRNMSDRDEDPMEFMVVIYGRNKWQ